MSIMCRPMWPFLLMYGSHDMRHSFSQVDGGQRDPWEMGRHTHTHTHIEISVCVCVCVCVTPRFPRVPFIYIYIYIYI